VLTCLSRSSLSSGSTPANANALIEARSWGGRKTDPELVEAIGQLGRVPRAARLRKELPPRPLTRDQRMALARQLRHEIWD
jgi:hypothetical protein